MEKENKKEEIQSRREFFKASAKKVLPVLGAMLLLNAPIMAHPKTGVSDCNGSCYTGCYSTCYRTCQNSCQGRCEGTCRETCKGGCHETCSYHCKYNLR